MARMKTRERIHVPTRDELMHPKPRSGWTCGLCGSRSTFYPAPHVPDKRRPRVLVPTGTGMLVCPHCTPLHKEQLPEWWHGKLAKPCGCGQPDCPVLTYAAANG